jgi:hypothetical protein
MIPYKQIYPAPISSPFGADPTEYGSPAVLLLLCAYIILVLTARCLDFYVFCDSVIPNFIYVA